MTRARMIMVAVALVGLLALAYGLLVAPRAVAHGWLSAFLLMSTAPIGAIAWLLVHRLTGGRWGDELAPQLKALAGLTPLIAVAFAPLALMLRYLYPWAADPTTLPHGVAYYLNQPLFVIRSALALAFWWFASARLLRDDVRPRTAAIGLLLHGVAITMVSYDWILSLQPRYGSTAFGANLAFEQMLTSLSVAAIMARRRGGPAVPGLGGLMLATLLGVFYLQIISYVVDWYGNLPDKAQFYADRDGAWSIVLLVALVVGALAPCGLLLFKRVRERADLLAAAGALCIFGVTLDLLWFVAPKGGAWWMGAFGVALVALVCAAAALTGYRYGTAHAEARHVG